MDSKFNFEFGKLELEEKMQIIIKQYELNLAKINVGRANPKILDFVHVNYYGTSTIVSQLANISVPEPQQLLIKPYDKSLNKAIVDAINKSSLNLYCIDEGDKGRIKLPYITQDKRKELVKSLGQYTERAKINIRLARQETNRLIKSSKEPEDEEKKMLNQIQDLTNSFILKVDQITKNKEKELMTI